MNLNRETIFRLNKFDPRAQFFAGVLTAVSVLYLQPLEKADRLYYLLLLIVLWSLARAQLIFIFKDILRVYPMLLFITFHLPFQKLGGFEIFGQVGPFTLYREGLWQFLAVHFKAFFLLNISFALSRSLSYKQIIALLNNWRTPHWAIAIYFYLQRMLQVFNLEAIRVKLALRARNLRLRRAASRHAAGNFLLMYLLRVWERSGRSSEAMVSRGFTGRFPIVYKLNWCFADTIFFLCTVLLTAGFWLWRIM